MNGKLFLLLYIVYIIALLVAYRFLVKYLEKRKIKKRLAQEHKLSQEENKNV